MYSFCLFIVFFFAVYGVLQIIAKSVFGFNREKSDALFVHRVIGVSDCQETIEGMIRSVVWEDMREELIVVDTGSTDETSEILKRLEKCYDFLKIMTMEEYVEYLRDKS